MFTRKVVLLTLLGYMSAGTNAQYCTFTVDVQYSFLAGITNVQLNGNPVINRSSNTTENNGFTNTAITTAVYKGQSYNFSITKNQDNLGCLVYDVRVYIDYNGDGDFDDADEEAVQMNNVPPGTGTASFIIPATAVMAQVGMRVALKMATGCGHIPITPCNNPPDGLGWHGEVEDYSLVIQNPTGIEDRDVSAGMAVFPNFFSNSALIQIGNSVKIDNAVFRVYDVLGRMVSHTVIPENTTEFVFDNVGLRKGFYFYNLVFDSHTIHVGKFVVE